MKQLELQYRTF